ncbi:PEGA domain-containing protein [Ottowia beijingensis]|uniref:PEGA domain-containing protein n=1 Tax=Ottowia beijingensis TaxID=1207057 RepID=A0A853ILA3_9BURK|nr:PEGA domain-containing protein [Ottowia beijingensis]NZA01062.1 PEGA domain-containing protein [Ottowia beijingensis]
MVYVDGQMQGLTPPLKQFWLQPGQHTIEVRNTGLPSHTETITIEAGKDVQLRHQFE